MHIVNLHHTAFVSTFRKLGHEVLSIGTTPDCDVRLAEPLSGRRFLDLLTSRGLRPDLVFLCDACQLPWVFGLEAVPAVTIFYSVDQYMHPWHVPYSVGFATLLAQKDYLPLFTHAERDRPALWLPLFCDPAWDHDPGTARDIPVAFVGTLDGPANPARRPFLAAFRRAAPLFATTGAYAPIYGRSRLVLNQSAAGELNFRIFEALACGAALLTEDTQNGLRELFTPGEHLLVYRRGDAADAARLANAALAAPGLAGLAAAGRRHVLARHTVTARARTVLDLARRLAAVGAPRQRLVAIDCAAAMFRKAFLFLGTDERLPLPMEQRRFFLEMARLCGTLISCRD